MKSMRHVALMLTVVLVAACGRDEPPETGSGTPGGDQPKATGGGTPDADWRARSATALARGAKALQSLGKDGRWSLKAGYPADLGTTALVARALLLAPDADKAALTPVLDWIAGQQQEDGGIYNPKQGVMTYVTAASILALKAHGDPKYQPVMSKAAEYLAKIQADEGEGFDESSENYGGIGYGSKRQFTNMSTSQFAIEAADAAGLKKDHKFYKKALKFLSRSQNHSETNDLPARKVDGVDVVPGNDGGAFYRPGESKAGLEKLADGRTVFRSYGSMTYALLKSYLLCDIDARDDRVKAALSWMSRNWELEWNPGMEHSSESKDARYQGLYYYYLSVARCLAVAEQQKVALPEELKDWRASLAAALLKRQNEDGTWTNQVGRWYEDSPALATSYAMIALQECLGAE